MINISMSVNRHIVDQLADVREQIKKLEEQEEKLKAEVSKQMGDADSLGGDEFIARQTVSTRAGSIDAKAMEKAGIKVEKYRKAAVTIYSIRVERREQPEAA